MSMTDSRNVGRSITEQVFDSEDWAEDHRPQTTETAWSTASGKALQREVEDCLSFAFVDEARVHVSEALVEVLRAAIRTDV
jgi:hypothetical protein